MILRSGIFFLMIAFAANSLFAGNLFSNSGFETNTTGWSINKHDSTKSNAKPIARDTAGAKFGKNYLKVEVTKVDSAKTNWWIQLWEPDWTVKRNVQYTYSCWVKTTDSTSHVFDIAATGVPGNNDSQYVYRTDQGNGQFNATNDWQKFTHSYTWKDSGTATLKAHFRLFIGGAIGILCFDSMALDSATPTMAKTPFVLSNRNETFNYCVQLLPNCMRIVLGNSASISNNVAIYSVGGRLLSSQNIPSATRSFELPKPAPGAWVVGVNSEKKVIQVH
jgi:hypothetical protein